MSLKVLLWLILVVPWLSLFFMPRPSIKRYMPVAIFASLLVTIIYEIAYTYKWWVLKATIVSWGHISNISFINGAFLVGTIWIFYFTYEKFWTYLTTNIVVDALFAFVVLNLTQYLGIDQLVNLSHFGVFLIMLSLAFVIFLYQRWQEGVFVNRDCYKDYEGSQLAQKRWFGNKGKIR